MNRLMIVAHAPLASALKAVAMHTFPEAAQSLVAVDVAPNETLQDVQSRLTQQLDEDPTLIVCDVQGATPSNAAHALQAALPERAASLAVIDGANVPMIWRALCYRREPLSCLTERASEGGTRGIHCDNLPPKPSA